MKFHDAYSSQDFAKVSQMFGNMSGAYYPQKELEYFAKSGFVGVESEGEIVKLRATQEQLM